MDQSQTCIIFMFFSAPRFQRIYKQTDIQREEVFEQAKPSLEIQIHQLQIDNKKLVELINLTSCTVRCIR